MAEVSRQEASAEGQMFDLRMPERCLVCGGLLTWVHDHQPDQSGLDDGPYLPGREPRKKAAPKSAEKYRDIRSRAWATRRQKYGQKGHR